MIYKTNKISNIICLLLTSILLWCNATNASYTIDTTHKNPQLQAITFPGLFQKATIIGQEAIFNLPYGTNITAINTHIETGNSVKCAIAKDGMYNYTKPVVFKLKEGNISKKYIIKVNVAATPDTTIRGIWVTNVRSTSLSSVAFVNQMLNDVDAAGMNTIFVVVFNKNQTLEPSEVLKRNVPAGVETQISGSGWDPLQVLIEKAHAKNIKVIPWFEYGFLSNNTGVVHPILDAHPDWAGIDQKGQPTVRNGFAWLNGFDPKVQQFMLDIIMEIVSKYDVDGFQCDDHMPGMPLNSGYDLATAAAYKKETGKTPPLNTLDSEWVQWRENRLTNFAEKIYKSIKAVKPNCLVSFAPAPLGASARNNLQDWEAWVRKGIYDIMSPLLYCGEKEGEKAYAKMVNKDEVQVIDKYKGLKKRYFPGMMVKDREYAPTDKFLASCLQYNRAKGISGEVMWYFDGLKSNTAVYKAFYPAKAVFPHNF
jgi:uncharacterized lipoprotein YddW (UPF0748 family)